MISGTDSVHPTLFLNFWLPILYLIADSAYSIRLFYTREKRAVVHGGFVVGFWVVYQDLSRVHHCHLGLAPCFLSQDDKEQ